MSLREPFHFRYMREIVGVFVLGSLTVGLGTLVALGSAQRWFERHVQVAASFAPEKVTVVHPGVPVRLAGEGVGQVVEVRVEKDRRAHVKMKVRLTAREALRADSTAILRVPIAGLVGDLAIELTPGGDAPPLADDAELPGLTQGDLLAELEGVFRELGADLPALAAEVTRLLGHVNEILAQAERGQAGKHAAELMARSAALAGQVEREQVVARAAGVVRELERLLAAVDEGEGSAGKLLHDPAFHDRVTRLLDDLHRSWGDVQKAIAAVGRIGEDGSALSAELRKRAEDLPALLDQTQRLLLRTNQTLEAMQRHWLLRGAVEEPSPLPEPPAVLDRAAPVTAPAPEKGGGP
jgi:phospholipid/cholesterol/gamma-HCH transport system substrate-binding protein